MSKIKATFALLSALVVTGCGSSNTHLNTPGAQYKTSFGESLQPTFGSGTISSGLQMATAGIAVGHGSSSGGPVSFTGNLNGWCDFSPTNSSINGPSWTPLSGFGVGPAGYLCGLAQIPDPLLTNAVQITSGMTGTYLLGAGTLSNLVVVASPGYTTAGTASGTVDVVVIRAGVLIPTTMTCSLGASAKTTTYSRCSDTTDTFTNQDGDQLILFINSSPGDKLSTIQWFVQKS